MIVTDIPRGVLVFKKEHGLYRVKSVDEVHAGLVWHYGKAIHYFCIECGDQANHWCYQYTAGEAELVANNARSTKYSENFEDYAPMCRSCHQAFDRKMDPAQFRKAYTVRQQAGQLAIAALIAGDPNWTQYRVENMFRINMRKRQCSCGLISNPAGVGTHQKFSGHHGYTDIGSY